MKVTIFGATGGVGQHVVAQALADDHEVTAYTRSPEKIEQSAGRLEIVKGDVVDLTSVRDVVRGRDAVVCALGMPPTNGAGLRASGTANIVRAMLDTGVSRLVCLSALGVGDSKSLLPFRYRRVIVPLFLRRVYADHEAQEHHVENSGLAWTLVRSGSFTNGARTGTYKHGFSTADSSLTFKISRPDVAAFLLRQLSDDTYLPACGDTLVLIARNGPTPHTTRNPNRRDI